MARPAAGLSLVSRLSGVWTAVVLAFLYLPVGLLVAYSFNRTGLSGGWHGVTLRWYADLPAQCAAEGGGPRTAWSWPRP